MALALVIVAPAADATSEWMSDQGGVLELKLAHLEKNAVDGGVLRIDRAGRKVSWSGIPGEMGCKSKLEVAFDDVKSAGTGDDPGFVLELKKGKPKKLVLIPVPHALSLLQRRDVARGGLDRSFESSGMAGPGGESMRASGSAGGAGPSLKKLELPAEVVSDTKKAVDAVREALGRKE